MSIYQKKLKILLLQKTVISSLIRLLNKELDCQVLLVKELKKDPMLPEQVTESMESALSHSINRNIESITNLKTVVAATQDICETLEDVYVDLD